MAHMVTSFDHQNLTCVCVLFGLVGSLTASWHQIWMDSERSQRFCWVLMAVLVTFPLTWTVSGICIQVQGQRRFECGSWRCGVKVRARCALSDEASRRFFVAMCIGWLRLDMFRKHTKPAEISSKFERLERYWNHIKSWYHENPPQKGKSSNEM